MSEKVNHAAPKSAKINPDAPKPEKEAPQPIPSPSSEAKPADDYRTELVKKAQAAKNAAAVGLIPQEQADDRPPCIRCLVCGKMSVGSRR